MSTESIEHDEEARLIMDMDSLAAADTAPRGSWRLQARAVALALRTGRDTRKELGALRKELGDMPRAVAAELRGQQYEGLGALRRILRKIGTREGLAALAMLGPLCVMILGRVGCQLPAEVRHMTPEQGAALVQLLNALTYEVPDASATVAQKGGGE